MPNAKDHKAQAKKILAVGNAGGGKTAAFCTLPGKKFIYIFDPSALETLQGQDVDYEIFLPDELNMSATALKAGVADRPARQKEPKAYREFEQDFEKKLESGFFNDYDVIGFDSMTTFSDALMDRILWLNKRLGKHPEMADWTATMNSIVNVLRTLTSIQGKVIYVTAHLDMAKDEVTGKIQNQLNLIGKLKSKLPLLFSDVWLFYADQDREKKTRFYIQTQQDRYNPFLRCSIRNCETVEDVTIGDWGKPEEFGVGKLLA